MSAVSLEEPESDQLGWAIIVEQPTQIVCVQPYQTHGISKHLNIQMVGWIPPLVTKSVCNEK